MKNIKKKIRRSFKSIFDFSFKKFITVDVLSFIYWLDVVIAGALTILVIIAGFNESLLLGLLAVILAPLAFVVYIIILRVVLETIAIIFRIADYMKILAKGEVRRKKIKVKHEEKES